MPSGKPPRPTIYDVARAAGVAPSTVSRTFSRPGRVSGRTAARVHAVAAELGYQVDRLVHGPHQDRTGMIALLVSDMTNPAYFGVVRGTGSAAAAAGYTTVLADTRESPDLERTVLDRLLPTVEGVLLTGSRMPDRAIRAAADRCPLVVLNRIVPGVRCVVPDAAAGIDSAMRHLRELGHHAVTYLAGPSASWADGQRWRALLELGPELGMKVTRLGPFAPTTAGGIRAAPATLREHPTAVLAYNDLIALGLLRGLAEAGARVPDDISVVGFDNAYGADLCSPPLTTIAIPLRAMGIEGFRELHRQILGDPQGARPAVPRAAELVVRSSTAPPARCR